MQSFCEGNGGHISAEIAVTENAAGRALPSEPGTAWYQAAEPLIGCWGPGSVQRGRHEEGPSLDLVWQAASDSSAADGRRHSPRFRPTPRPGRSCDFDSRHSLTCSSQAHQNQHPLLPPSTPRPLFSTVLTCTSDSDLVTSVPSDFTLAVDDLFVQNPVPCPAQ